MVSPYFLTNIAPGCTVLVNMKGADMKRFIIIGLFLLFAGCATSHPRDITLFDVLAEVTDITVDAVILHNALP